MNTAARGARRRRALARRRRAPTGLDQSHEDGANRGLPIPNAHPLDIESNPRSASHLLAPRCADTVEHYLKQI